MSLSEILGCGLPAIILILSFIKIPKLELNIWGWIGKSIVEVTTKSLNERIDILNKKLDNNTIKISEVQCGLDDHLREIELTNVKNARLRILRFNNELLRGEKSSLEQFNEILEDIDFYNRYCLDHPDYENTKAVMSIKNIKKEYENCLENKSFLE